MRKITIFLAITVFLVSITIPATGIEPLKKRTIKETAPLPTPQPTQKVPPPVIPKEIAVGPPVIESLFSAPLGALRPLTKLYINGKHFGKKPGKILLYREGYSPVELINVNWVSDEKVNGTVPESTKNWPNQTVTIKVQSADNRLSKPKTVLFVAWEEKLLERQDIVVEHCGSDGNYNRCNHVRIGDGDCGEIIERRYQGDPYYKSLTIFGFHCNAWGAVGDDTGRDRYSIILKNGWVFKSRQGGGAHSSSEAFIEGPIPSIPVGRSEWRFEFAWSATPADWVKYEIEKIVVEGPVGTHYK